MTKAMVALQVRAARLREEAGQGTLEYVGMVIVAAILVMAVVEIASGGALSTAFQNQITKVTGAGG
jgi:hypothetical protein